MKSPQLSPPQMSLRLSIKPWSNIIHRYFLAKNPKAMAKLEAELDAAGLLKTPQNPIPRQFTHADIGKLHYLDWCIKVRACDVQFSLKKGIITSFPANFRAAQMPGPPWEGQLMCALFSSTRQGSEQHQ